MVVGRKKTKDGSEKTNIFIEMQDSRITFSFFSVLKWIPFAVRACVPVDAAAVSAALDGKAQIKVEQKCWGYHAHTTKIDAERVKRRAQ